MKTATTSVLEQAQKRLTAELAMFTMESRRKLAEIIDDFLEGVITQLGKNEPVVGMVQLRARLGQICLNRERKTFIMDILGTCVNLIPDQLGELRQFLSDMNE